MARRKTKTISVDQTQELMDKIDNQIEDMEDKSRTRLHKKLEQLADEFNLDAELSAESSDDESEEEKPKRRGRRSKKEDESVASKKSRRGRRKKEDSDAEDSKPKRRGRPPKTESEEETSLEDMNTKSLKAVAETYNIETKGKEKVSLIKEIKKAEKIGKKLADLSLKKLEKLADSNDVKFNYRAAKDEDKRKGIVIRALFSNLSPKDLRSLV